MSPALVTLLMGLVLGYLAQRSRICFIGGLRDFILVRDTELVKGAVAFFLTAWLAFSAANALGLTDLRAPALQAKAATASAPAVEAPAATGLNAIFPDLTNRLASTKPSLWVMTVLAGIGLGLFSTLANGCPTRQHVLAAQGLGDARFYLVGFYLGVVVYDLVTKPLLALIM